MSHFWKYILPTALMCAVLAYLVSVLPILPSNAAFVRGQDASNDLLCGNAGTLHVNVTSDTCPSGVASIADYQPAVTFSVDNPQGKFIDWDWHAFFCKEGNPALCDPSNQFDTKERAGDHIDLTNGPVTAETPALNHGQFTGQVCGSYQQDLQVAVYHFENGNRIYDCAYGVKDPIGHPTRAFFCHTNNTCTAPTPTPTKPATPTPTQPVVTPTVTPTAPVTPTVTQVQTPTPTPTTPTCGTCVTQQTITVNVNQQQQQQQQIVLAATVAPAPTTSSLPRTGGDGFAVIATLLSLIPAGWKLKKFV